jgi:cell division protein FtsB
MNLSQFDNKESSLKEHIGKPDVSQNDINKILKLSMLIVLVLALASSFLSYTLVLCKENDLLELHKKTSYTHSENIELKTEVEFVKSFYNVQNKASTLNFLHKPDKIIEIEDPSAKTIVNVDDFPRISNERVVRGY